MSFNTEWKLVQISNFTYFLYCHLQSGFYYSIIVDDIAEYLNNLQLWMGNSCPLTPSLLQNTVNVFSSSNFLALKGFMLVIGVLRPSACSSVAIVTVNPIQYVPIPCVPQVARKALEITPPRFPITKPILQTSY